MYDTAKLKIRRSFDKSADHYDNYATFQRETAAELADKIARSGAGGRALDIGCGTGSLAALMAESEAFENIVALDLSLGMSRKAKERSSRSPGFVVMQADADTLPVRKNSFDLIVSNLALQWMADPAHFFGQIAPALRSHGRFMATTLGIDTFWELREAWAAAVDKVGDNPVFHPFVSERELEEKMVNAGFEMRIQSARRIRSYKSLTHLLRSLKKRGAQNSPGLCKLGLGRRDIMMRVMEEYQSRFADNGHVMSTYHLVFIDAVKTR